MDGQERDLQDVANARGNIAFIDLDLIKTDDSTKDFIHELRVN